MISPALPSFSFVCLMCFFSCPPFSLVSWALLLKETETQKERQEQNWYFLEFDVDCVVFYPFYSYTPFQELSWSLEWSFKFFEEDLLFLILSRVSHLMPILFLSIETQTSLFPWLEVQTQSTDGRQDDRPTNDYLCLASPDVVSCSETTHGILLILQRKSLCCFVSCFLALFCSVSFSPSHSLPHDFRGVCISSSSLL